MKPIVLIGGGGHARSIIDSILQRGEWDIIGILDEPSKVGQTLMGIPIIGTDDQMEDIYAQGITHAFIGVGSIGNPIIRKRIYQSAHSIGYSFPNIIDSTAILAQDVEMGEGNFIGKGAIVNAGSKLGNQIIINSGAIIEHDCSIQDFAHIAPGTVLCGGVSIGKESHIGARSVVIQGKTVGNNTLVGAGSVVVKDIKDCKKAYGNPCKEVD